MCRFKELYGATFAKVFAYMEKFYGASTDEEWTELFATVDDMFSTKGESALIRPVLDEICRIAEVDKAKGYKMTPYDRTLFGQIYRPMFERLYNFAKQCFYANMASTEEMDRLRSNLQYAKTYTPFESEMAAACYELFVGLRQAQQPA